MMLPSQRRLFPLLLAAVAFLSGCAGKGSWTGDFPARGPVIPATNVRLSDGFNISLEKIVYWGAVGSAVYLVLDPLNPNWEIEEAAFPDNHYHFSLKMKRYYAGGAGEARVAFNHRAKELMRRGGFDGYTIVEYNEGLESSVLGSQRVTQGVIQLTRKAG
jgi:hypothetical protein